MTTKKNYYVCLRFKSRPEIHMTLRYLKDLAPAGLASVTGLIDKFMIRERVGQFTPKFSLEAWYGPQHTVRVLEPKSDERWPEWLELLLTQLPPEAGKYTYCPHVVCRDRVLCQRVIAVSLMCKKVEVARWDLT